ncbi:C2H2 finger domain-containing protein, mycelia-enriched transcript [Histoplasma ohiense]|nr:C2H2 finger domain-containing protein, mycelia-enriched transcript [Histoplasma ohiense (nom. inval.)]
MHRFLNWCCKLEYNPDTGRRLKCYKKASALNADWKYFRIYYTWVTKHEMSEEMREAVHTGMRYLVDKHSLDKQPRENVSVYIEDMVPFNKTILQIREK